MRKQMRPLIGILVFLILWQIAALWVNKSIIPAPLDTIKLLLELIVSKGVIVAAGQTAWKVFLTLLLVLCIGIPAGLLLGISEVLYEMFRPIILVIQATPVIFWLSLVIFAWGIGWKGPVFIAFLSLLPVAILTTVSGVRNLDKNLLEMAKLYQVPRHKILREIYLGSLLPFILAILDVSLGQAWKVILVAEYLTGNSGLGVQILMSWMNIDFPKVWALTLIAVLLGIVTERLLKFIMGRLSRQWMHV